MDGFLVLLVSIGIGHGRDRACGNGRAGGGAIRDVPEGDSRLSAAYRGIIVHLIGGALQRIAGNGHILLRDSVGAQSQTGQLCAPLVGSVQLYFLRVAVGAGHSECDGGTMLVIYAVKCLLDGQLAQDLLIHNMDLVRAVMDLRHILVVSRNGQLLFISLAIVGNGNRPDVVIYVVTRGRGYFLDIVDN